MPDQPTHVFDRVASVEIHQRRWDAAIRIIYPDGLVTEFLACAQNEHSGLWLYDPAEHEEH